MSNETPQAPASEAPNATELQPGANAAAPVDGVASPDNEQQPPEANEGEGDKSVDPRSARYRFSEMSKALREEQRRRAFLEGQLEALRSQNGYREPPQAPQPQAQPVSQPAADNEPDPESYPGKAYDPAYQRDLSAWAGRQEARKLFEAQEQRAREAESQRQAEAEFNAGRQRYESAKASAAEVERDFPQYAQMAVGAVDLVASSEPPGVPGRLIDIVTKADNPAWVSLALATNPQLMAQVRGLNAYDRALAIGRIDAQISANLSRSSQPAPTAQPSAAQPAAAQPSAQPAPSSPQAVTPPAHLNGRGATPSLDPSKARDVAEFIAIRKQQMGLN